jgi:hypothetical protein
MKTVLAITDVTRMYEGRVCVAGYDKNGKCIRPVLPHPGLHERSLYSRGRPIVFPFAIVALDLLEPLPHAPHTEDCDFEPTSIRLIDQLDDKHNRQGHLRSPDFDQAWPLCTRRPGPSFARHHPAPSGHSGRLQVPT